MNHNSKLSTDVQYRLGLGDTLDTPSIMMANGATIAKYHLSILFNRVWFSIVTDISVVSERKATYLAWIMKQPLGKCSEGVR